MQVSVEFAAELIEWRGPAPFYFAPLTEDAVRQVRETAGLASYGWGVVPVAVTIGATEFTTSLLPRQGGYLLPIKDAVRKAEGIRLGDTITAKLVISF